MTLYLDTSAAVSIFLEEARTAIVTQLVASADEQVVVSDLTAGELSAAISTAVRMNRLGEADAREALDDFDQWQADATISVTLDTEDMRAATALVRRFDLGLPFPDALHLAICQRKRMTLVTGDKRQALAAEAIGLPIRSV